MRGLLMQRAYLLRRGQKLGPAYIIFGSRSSKEGLFTDEIKMFHQLGALTEVYLCYSREPGQKKMYAPSKLRSAEVTVFLEPFLASEYINQYFKSAHSYHAFHILSHILHLQYSPPLQVKNSHIYICGSADLAEECKAIMKEHTSKESFDAITKDGRLHCDVFGAVTPKSQVRK